MKLLQNIFGRVWAVWGMIAFSSTLLVVVIPIWLTYYIKEPQGTETFRRISKVWMDVFLFLIGCPVRVRGKKKFEKGRTYIVVCNHSSLMDVPITTPYIPGANKTIAKIEMSRIPLFGLIYSRGAVLVDRKSDESRKKSLEEMKRVLANGIHMCIYPEGTRNKTGQPLKSFYDGAFRLASDTGTSIMPAIMRNTAKALPINKKFFLRPIPLSIDFLDPIEVNKGDDSTKLKEMVFKIMWDEISKK